MEINVAITSGGSGDVLELREDLNLCWNGMALTIPAGFHSDGASVPEILWNTVSPAIDPRTLRGSLAHDYIYRVQPANWTRKMADEMFYDLIREDGLSWYRAQKAYWGVRIFGGLAWRENQAAESQKDEEPLKETEL